MFTSIKNLFPMLRAKHFGECELQNFQKLVVSFELNTDSLPGSEESEVER